MDFLHKQDQDCLKYSEFWFLFKILRILFPLLAVLKLPFLIFNCTKSVEDDQYRESFEEDSKSWMDAEKFKSPIKLTSSFPKMKDSPYFGRRLAPLGEEKDTVVSTLKKKGREKRNIIGVFAAQTCDKANSGKEHEVNKKDENDFDSVFESDLSNPSSLHNTISTPIHEGLKTPSFDLSKVPKLVYHNNHRRHNLSMDGNDVNSAPLSAPPVSTFRSTFPAVLREQLVKVNTNKITDNGDGSMKKPKFVFSAAYHHPLAPVNYSGPVTDRTRHESLPEQSLAPPPVVQGLKETRFSSISRSSGKKAVPSSLAAVTPSIDEISRRARSKSVTSSQIDWKKLP